MEIKIQPNININLSGLNQTKNFSYIKKQNSSDCFISSAQPLAFKGLLKRIFKSNKNDIADLSNYEIPTPYAAEVAEGLNKVMDCNYPASNLSSLMSSGEFMQILPSLTADSYIYSNKNLASGVYCADLDYQTSFSDGKENVIDLLDSVAQYADNYSKETGKPFIFALTDKDSIEGVQHAVRIIASQPKKFQNVKFIPGIKLSFAHEAPNSMLGYENSDMLLYGINPFSPNVINFVESTIQKRKTMIIDFIKKVNALYPEFAYNVIEFAKQNRIKYKKGFAVSNLYWRAREYAETKGDTEIRGISMVPEDILSEAEEILSELDKVYLGSDEKTHSASGSDIIKNSEVNKSIKEVFDEYSTHFDPVQGKVVSSDEKLYDEMIECFSKESQRPVMAISNPYYFSHYFNGSKQVVQENTLKFFNKLTENSKGMLVAFESVCPDYEKDEALTTDKIKEFNNFMRQNTNLYEVGGSFAKRLI